MKKNYVADRGDNSYMGYLVVSNLYVILNLSGSVTEQADTQGVGEYWLS